MKLLRMTLHTPIKEFDIELQKTDSTKEEIDEMLTDWGRLLSGKLEEGVKLDHFKFGLSSKVSIVLPTLVLQNSFITIEVENE